MGIMSTVVNIESYCWVFWSVGTITFRANTGGTIFQNITNSDHILRYGFVDTAISGNSSRGYFGAVVGGGSNTNQLVAGANQTFGPIQFQYQLSQAARELKKTCGG